MKKELSLLVDSHHGIYSAQILAQSYGKYLQIDRTELNILKAGPDDDNYIETWAAIDGCEIIDESGEKYFIWQNEDIWAVPDGWEWSEEDETYIEPCRLDVEFYIEKETGDIIAYFPTEQWGICDGTFTCYVHLGQHGACHPDYLKECTKADPVQYAELLAELKGLGYNNLKIS